MRRNHQYRHAGYLQLEDRFVREHLRRNPVAATWMGEHAYDDLLPESGAEAVERDIAFMKEMRALWEQLPERELSLDERLDRRLVLYHLQNELFMLEDARRWRLGSDLARIVGDSLFPLFVRDFAPWHQRVERMVSRLKAAPAFFMSGRSLFQAVPPLFLRVYLESAQRLPELFDAISASIAGRVPEFLVHEFRKAALEAKKALHEHTHWLEQAIAPKAAGDWALGPAAFQGLLNMRQLGLTPGDLRELGEATLQKCRSRIQGLARKMVGEPNRDAALRRIQQNAPKSFTHALDVYRDAVTRCRAFIEINGFATLPGDETLEIMETPSYMAHLIPFAAYISPERTARPQKGIYVVTRGKDESDMSRFNYPDIMNTSVHEAYPGHHLQQTGQNLHPSRIRGLVSGNETVEGWAHYCEEEMKRLGFENGDDNVFIQTVDEAWRAARVLIDVNLHFKAWSADQAAQFLRQNTTMDQESAESEIKWYVQSPGYPLSYLAGKHLIYRLKENLARQFGSDFRDRAFHDAVIYEGGIPLALASEFYPAFLKDELRQSPAAIVLR